MEWNDGLNFPHDTFLSGMKQAVSYTERNISISGIMLFTYNSDPVYHSIAEKNHYLGYLRFKFNLYNYIHLGGGGGA